MTDQDWVTLDAEHVEEVLLAAKNGASPDTPREWEPLKANAFLDLPEPAGVELLGPLVLRGGRTLIGGDSGHGKTTLSFAMTAAILQGEPLLGYTGAGLGPALIIDLEQGVRSIKRGIRAAGLDDTDTYILNLPDGIALDQNAYEVAQLEHAIADLQPVVIVLDPYYKAHRGDSNEERAVTDLMRNLDRLRTDYLFGLILPAHVRKEQQAGGARRLTLADIAGSGAISRGAEIVLALERLSHGHARLRYLKDREGELPVGDAIELTYDDDGFQIVDKPNTETTEQRILQVRDSEWMTVKEWAVHLGLRQNDVRGVLERLAASAQIVFQQGPPGRHASAKCFATTGDPEIWDHPGSPGSPGQKYVGDPGDPTPLRSRGIPDHIHAPHTTDPGSRDDIELP